MFKKTQRLTKAEFDEYFKSGKRHHFPIATVISASISVSKISVVVSKKVFKSAVKRNLLRRRTYALVREGLINSQYRGVLIIIFKPKVATLSRKKTAEEINQMIDQVTKSA